MGVPILTRLIYSMAIVTALIFWEIHQKHLKFAEITRQQWLVLFGIGIFASGFNYFMQLGFTIAPNVGYVNAANAGSISLLTLLSAFLFHDELSWKKMVGIIGVTGGLFLLFLN